MQSAASFAAAAAAPTCSSARGAHDYWLLIEAANKPRERGALQLMVRALEEQAPRHERHKTSLSGNGGGRVGNVPVPAADETWDPRGDSDPGQTGYMQKHNQVHQPFCS
jgi:hypothetical protein